MIPVKVWQIVKQMEETELPDAQRELGEIRATLIANFGPKGECKPGLVDPNRTTMVMMCQAFQAYAEKETPCNAEIVGA